MGMCWDEQIEMSPKLRIEERGIDGIEVSVCPLDLAVRRHEMDAGNK
jgi:hypothetical protein